MRKSNKKKPKETYADIAADFNAKVESGLRWYFSLVVFIVLAGSTLLVGILAYIAMALGVIGRLRIEMPLLIVLMIVSSIIIGTIITIFVSKQVLRPINELSRAMKQVSQGDFSVRLNEHSSPLFVRRINATFNHMAHELSTVETLRNDFVSNVSHEIKTPLSAIEGYAVLLQDDSLTDEERHEYTDRIIDGSKRLSTLVANILMMSKIESENITVSKNTYRIDEQIRQNLLSLEPKWTEKDIEFDIDMDSIEFTAAESLMNHVFTNLIDNAVKFSPHGGTVGISLAEREGMLIFEISNSGQPITDEAMEHIFDKFYQGDTSHRSEGNGLGLALVKKIVQLHNGSIHAGNTPEGLVIFTVELPFPKEQKK